MEKQMYSIFIHSKYLCTTGYGWFISLLALFWNFIHPEIYCFGVVGAAILIDLIWGIIVAVKEKKFVFSESIRNTFIKVNIYGTALLLIYAIERGVHDDWFIGTKIACAIAAGCEFWSISASMLIVKPNMPFIRLFRMQLKGEMEKKLGQGVNDILKENKNG